MTPLDTKTDHLLIVALTRGDSVREAASVAKISKATAYRRLADPEFAARLAEAKEAVMDKTVQQLGNLAEAMAKNASKASAVLNQLLDSTRPAIRLGASRLAIDFAVKLRDQQELLECLEKLEAEDAKDDHK